MNDRIARAAEPAPLRSGDESTAAPQRLEAADLIAQGPSVVAQRALEDRVNGRREVGALDEQQRRHDGSPRVRELASLQAMMSSRAPGRSELPEGLRGGIEALSGVSMDGVKVHRDSPRPAQLSALAFAQGNEIHLGPGQEAHLPHEAWHLVQQAQGRVAPTLQAAGLPINDEPGLEREADQMGERAARMSVGDAPAARRLAQRPVSSGVAPIQGVWGFIDGRDGNRVQLKNIGDGTFTFAGKTYVRTDRTTKNTPVFALQGTTEQKKSSTVLDESLDEVLEEVSVEKIEKAKDTNLGKRSRVDITGKDKKQKRVESESTPLSFESLGGTRKAQVRGLATGIDRLVQERFEQDLAETIFQDDEEGVGRVGDALEKEDVEDESWKTSRRDQSNSFDYPIGGNVRNGPTTTKNITRINPRLGGSLEKTKSTPIKGKLETEDTLTGDGDIKLESQYAEYHRELGNRVSGGLDDRVAKVLGKSSEKDEDGLLLFAYLHKEKGMSYFEVLQSSMGEKPLEAQGSEVFKGLKLPEDWNVTPDYFNSGEFLSVLANLLYGKDAEVYLGVPEALAKQIFEMVDSIREKGAVDDSVEIPEGMPLSIWHELGRESQEAIGSVGKKNYEELKEKFAEKEDPAGYIAAVLSRGEELGDKHAGWYKKLARVLLPPSQRDKALDKGGTLGKKVEQTMVGNVKAVAEKLGAHDYGLDVEGKKEAIEKLVKDDPTGAYAITKYIAGNFSGMSASLDAPWEQAGKEDSMQGLHDAVRGLEQLPVHQGWSYRREAFDVGHSVGEIIAPGVLWSTAVAPKFGDQFDRGGKGAVYAVHGQHTGRDVQLLAGKMKWYQREVLFPPYARFVVEGKEKDPRYGVVYTVKELDPEETDEKKVEEKKDEENKDEQLSDERDDIQIEEEKVEEPPSHEVSEDKALRTLIDKKHWDKASEKLARQDPWTFKEATKAGIEGLGSGLHHPRDLYGEETARRWRKALQWKPNEEQLAGLWTLDGFLEIAETLSGEEPTLRDEPSGWGSGDDAYYGLSPEKADNLIENGLRVGSWFGKKELHKNWDKGIEKLGDDGDYRHGESYDEMSKKEWIQTIKKEMTKSEKEEARKKKDKEDPAIWLWRQSSKAMAGVGAIKKDGDREYSVKYGTQNKKEIEEALTEALKKAGETLAHLDPMDKDYARKVTGVAASLQQQIVVIHPFEDGNGRISRLYMYKVLQSYLPESDDLDTLPVIPDTGADQTTSTQDWGDQLWSQVDKS